MQLKNTYLLIILLLLVHFSYKSSHNEPKQVVTNQLNQSILPGAYNTKAYFPFLKDKRVAVVGNQTSEINVKHLVDTLLQHHINIVKVFAPEHGFRGQASAGEKVANSKDIKTGLPIISLYGKHKKPTPEDLQDVDLIVFDIQDVGARFYTYLSTLHYVMEAAAEQQKPLIVLDRPNPNSDYIDGPVLENNFKSFVGMHPVPIVYAMTIGEYARMINGEHWLKNGIQANLQVIKIQNYKHGDVYKLPVKPSPNLPNYQAVRLYPSLCFFEGTDISVGRGTDFPFQVYGSPYLPPTNFSFVPKVNAGSKWPKHEGQVCYGEDLRLITPPTELYLKWLIKTYHQYPDKTKYFNKFFERLSGTITLRTQIELGKSSQDIKKTWQPALEKFKNIRQKYLLYKDFK
ncbi:MAG TPA: DUF1343 domain-containing protein [Flavobacteriales bacterium]|nr:DUF1343 domain-containing protein [Flavobacteriales bacterium]